MGKKLFIVPSMCFSSIHSNGLLEMGTLIKTRNSIGSKIPWITKGISKHSLTRMANTNSVEGAKISP